MFYSTSQKEIDTSFVKTVFVTGLTFPLAKAITELGKGVTVQCIFNISKPVVLGDVISISESREKDGFDVDVRVSIKDTAFDETAQFRFINGPCNVAYLVQIDKGE